MQLVKSPRFIRVYKITDILRVLWLVNRVAKPMFYCIGKHIESGYVAVPVIAEERENNFSNFDLTSAFGLEMSEGENQFKINQSLSK